jgi:prepilin-type N-terminal cleavage/methylation domain-containing protein
MKSARGFTLLELMISLSILTAIMLIIYVSFSSVVNATEVVRGVAEDLRMKQFLSRQFHQLLPAVRADLAVQIASYEFVGEDGSGAYGPADTLKFCAAVPLLGSKSLPGLYKIVTFEVADANAPEEEDALTGVTMNYEAGTAADEPDLMLRFTEQPLVVDVLGEEGDLLGSADIDKGEFASWSVPVRTLDFAYFDGEEWIEEWNSIDLGLLPWAVRVRVNFQKDKADLAIMRDRGIDPEEDPDFELIVMIPAGAGTLEPFIPLNPALANLSQQENL